MNKIIIGAAGKKQSGKNTLCNFLKIILSDYDARKIYYQNGIINNYNLVEIENIIKMYSFADMLKQKICIDIIGLSWEQCYGTDEQKNNLTLYKWENLPDEIRAINTPMWDSMTGNFAVTTVLRNGYITAREIMQIVGTNIFRKYFDNNIWITSLFRKIQKEKCIIGLISDIRFPGEIETIIEKGGYVVKLLRDVCETNGHSSETSLDNYDFTKLGDHCFILDNREMNIDEQNRATMPIVDKILLDIKKRKDKK